MPNGFAPPTYKSRAKGIGFASALASLAQNIPSIYQAYLDNEDERKQEGYKQEGSAILSDWDRKTRREEREAAAEVPPEGRAAEQARIDAELSPQFDQPAAVPSATAQMAKTAAGAPGKATTPKGLEHIHKYDPMVNKYSSQYGVPKELVQTVIGIESYGQEGAVSETGVRGLMQVTQDTAADYGVGKAERATPEGSIKAGTAHLARLQKKYGDDWRKIWAAYNAGEKWIDDAIEMEKSKPNIGWENILEANLISAGKREKIKELRTGLERGQRYYDQFTGGVTPTGTTTARTSSLTQMQSQGAVTDALQQMIADKPKRPGDITGKTQKKLDYFYSQASPDVVEAMKPTLDALQQMSKSERGKIENEWRQYENSADRWARAVLTAASIGAGLKKHETTGQTKLTSQNIQALKTKKSLIENQIKLYRDVAKTYAKAGKNQRERIQKQYPDLFKAKKKGLFRELFNMDPVKIIDTMFITRLQKEITDINARLAQQSALPSPAQATQGIPATGGAPGQQTTGSANINKWITD